MLRTEANFGAQQKMKWCAAKHQTVRTKGDVVIYQGSLPFRHLNVRDGVRLVDRQNDGERLAEALERTLRRRVERDVGLQHCGAVQLLAA